MRDFLIAPASGQRCDDDGEGVCAAQACGVDGGPHVGLGLRGPHGAIAVGDLSLDHAGSQLSFRGVVGDVDLAGIIAERQQLVSRPAAFGLQFPRQIAAGGRGQECGEAAFKVALFPRQGRGGETGDARGQIECLAKPQPEPQRQIVLAMLSSYCDRMLSAKNRFPLFRRMLQREGRVARQMRQTGLVSRAVLLLGRGAIRYPHLRNMAAHRLVGDAGGTRIIGLMHHGVLAVEHPVIRVRPLDPHADFVAGDDFRRPQKSLRLASRFRLQTRNLPIPTQRNARKIVMTLAPNCKKAKAMGPIVAARMAKRRCLGGDGLESHHMPPRQGYRI
jgi:hypothetical protein